MLFVLTITLLEMDVLKKKIEEVDGYITLFQ